MSTVDVVKDTEALTLTVTAEFAATADRVWQVWADPRKLERWWGPPTWPATFVDHDFVTGGRATYFMTGPEGEKAHGWWQFERIDAPRSLAFEDGFADDSGEPSSTMPVTHAVVTFEEVDGGTRMTMVSHFRTLEQLEQLVEMGMSEGIREAVGQIEDLIPA